MLRRLPVGPFDATRVDASACGYKRFETPDGLLTVASHTATATLASLASTALALPEAKEAVSHLVR